MKNLLLLLLLAIPAIAQTEKPKVLYWSSDNAKCPICDGIVIDGSNFSIFETPEHTLTFTTSVNEKMIYVGVYLRNKSESRIDFDPNKSLIGVFKKRSDKEHFELTPMSPEEAAKKMKGSQGLKNYFTALGASMQRRSVFVNSQSSGNVSVSDTRGNTASGTYDGRSTSTISVPNEDAEERAQQKIDERNRQASARFDAVLSNALRSNTVLPQKKIIGNIYFPMMKGEVMYVSIRVGDTLYTRAVTGIK